MFIAKNQILSLKQFTGLRIINAYNFTNLFVAFVFDASDTDRTYVCMLTFGQLKYIWILKIRC